MEKSALRVNCYGTIDELNAQIGLLRDQLDSIPLINPLLAIQHRLFVIGAALACDPGKAPKMAIPDLTDDDIYALEKEIDLLSDQLPKMTHFILPGGHIFVSQAHISRCVCRRAERECVALLIVQGSASPTNTPLQESTSTTTEQPPVTDIELSDKRILKYLNRLSDYLFVLGRFVGLKLNVPEIKWIPRG